MRLMTKRLMAVGSIAVAALLFSSSVATAAPARSSDDDVTADCYNPPDAVYYAPDLNARAGYDCALGEEVDVLCYTGNFFRLADDDPSGNEEWVLYLDNWSAGVSAC